MERDVPLAVLVGAAIGTLVPAVISAYAGNWVAVIAALLAASYFAVNAFISWRKRAQ